MSTLSREQAEFHAHQIIYGDIYSIKDHVALLLAQDAAHRASARSKALQALIPLTYAVILSNFPLSIASVMLAAFR